MCETEIKPVKEGVVYWDANEQKNVSLMLWSESIYSESGRTEHHDSLISQWWWGLFFLTRTFQSYLCKNEFHARNTSTVIQSWYCVLLITQLLRLVGRLGSRKSITGKTRQTGSCMSLLGQTERPKSVGNCCVIEVLVAFCVVTLLFGIFCWCKGFCHRTE